MAFSYCEYCGSKFSSPAMMAGSCSRHPTGSHKGKHKLYEGQEKKIYSCKFCGTTSSSIAVLGGGTCSRHPNGSHQGKHSPAL